MLGKLAKQAYPFQGGKKRTHAGLGFRESVQMLAVRHGAVLGPMKRATTCP